MTDPLGQSQVLPYLQGLSKKGFKYHLISFEKTERFKTNKPIIQEICMEHGIEWIPLTYTKNPPVLSTILDIYKLYRIVKRLHSQETFSIVHCRSYISSIVGLKMKRKFGVKFLFDMRGFWADERVDGQLWNLKNPLYKSIYTYFKSKEKQFLLESDHVVSLTHAGKKELISWPGNASISEKISVIPCCADLTSFDPTKINEPLRQTLIEKFNLVGKIVLGYVGSLGTWYMLDEMLLFYKVQKQKIPNLHFLFITKDDERIIFQKANSLNIDSSCISVSSAERKDISTYMSLLHWSVFFILPSFSKIASSPTKQGELMSMGIPLIVNSGVGDTEKVVTRYKSGIAFNELNENSFQSKSIYHYEDFDRVLTIKGAQEFYGLNKGIDNYFSIYQKML